MRKKVIVMLVFLVAVALVLVLVDLFVFNPTHKAKTLLTQNEIISIFEEHEEAFEYIKNKLVVFDGYFKVGVTKIGKRVVFYDTSVVPKRLDVGYEKDERFEEIVKQLLVNLELGEIYFVRTATSLTIQFGHYQRILYREGGSEIKEDWPYAGQIKGNWFYEIFSPV